MPYYYSAKKQTLYGVYYAYGMSSLPDSEDSVIEGNDLEVSLDGNIE